MVKFITKSINMSTVNTRAKIKLIKIDIKTFLFLLQKAYFVNLWNCTTLQMSIS
jgi:hypothetical protein